MDMSEQLPINSNRYAKCIEVSKRIRWDIDRDVIRGRQFDFTQEVPARRAVDGRAPAVPRPATSRRLFSQIQGRTYANMFGLVERFIGAKILEVSRDHWLGDQVALEALVRFTDEELKHQELFRRLETMVGRGHARGLRVPAAAERCGQGGACKVDLGRAGAHLPHRALHPGALPLRASSRTPELSELWKDVFLFHWREESQHAILDEMEWHAREREAHREAARPGS